MKYFPRVLLPLEVDAGPFPRFPALLGQNAAATELELSLALRSSKVPLPSHATDKRDAETVSGHSYEAFEVGLQLSCTKVKNSDAAGAVFPADAFSGSAAFLPTHLSGAASGPSLCLAVTGPLSATPLRSSPVSARFSPAESLVAAVATASGLGVPLAGSPALSPAGIATTQQPQGRKRSQPPKDPAELSNNPRSKQQQEHQHGLAGEKREAEHLKRNDRMAHCCACEAVKKTHDWLEALAEKQLELAQAKEDEVVSARYVFSM